MHGVYKDWSQSACALQAVLDGNVSPVDHKHKHSTVNYEKIWVFWSISADVTTEAKDRCNHLHFWWCRYLCFRSCRNFTTSERLAHLCHIYFAPGKDPGCVS